jgi:hypothetical protein
MIRQLTVTTCLLFTTSIVSTILALPCHSGFGAITSVNFANQNKASFDVLANIYPKDQSFDPKPGGDGQLTFSSLSQSVI